MSKLTKEALLWVLNLLPLVYLATIWSQLPDQVPTHFGLDGQADDWSSKTMLIFLPGCMVVAIYLLMLAIPAIDPKKKLQEMGMKYDTLRFVISVFMTLLSLYILYVSKAGSMQSPAILMALVGLLIAAFGNYFQTIRPNYFIGIRTPWTIENEVVWSKTHKLGGKIWMVGGLLMAIIPFFVPDPTIMLSIIGVIFGVLVIVPIGYSYFAFREEKKKEE